MVESQIRRSPLLDDGPKAEISSGSFIVTGTASSLSTEPVSNIVSAIPRSDIILMRTAASALPTLPVSPYPAHRDTAIRAHFVSYERPQESGWTPWVGGTWSKWVRGTILGYRDFAGRETNVCPVPSTLDDPSDGCEAWDL